MDTMDTVLANIADIAEDTFFSQFLERSLSMQATAPDAMFEVAIDCLIDHLEWTELIVALPTLEDFELESLEYLMARYQRLESDFQQVRSMLEHMEDILSAEVYYPFVADVLEEMYERLRI